jgi:hypothetical protein
VIVHGHGTDEASMTALLHAMLGDRITNVGMAVEVRAAGGRDRPDLDKDGHRMRTPLHTDGFALADGAPDVLALGCERAARDGGGASFMVDADAVHRAIDEEFAAFLVDTDIDQTEPGKLPMVGPIGLRREGASIAWRCSYYLRPRDTDPDRHATHQRIDDWLWLLEDLAAGATRFHLTDGDVLVSDNTRTFHGRDPYVDTDRLLWRLWCWTDAAPVPLTAYRGSDTSLIRTK